MTRSSAHPTLIERLIELLQDREANRDHILELLRDQHPADIAELMEQLSELNVLYIIQQLDYPTLGAVFSEFDPLFRQEIINQLDDDVVAGIVMELVSDDAADLLSEIESEERVYTIIELLPVEDRINITDLMQHEEDTAGGIMAKEILTAYPNSAVKSVLEKIRDGQDEIDNINNVFIVDHTRKLIGLVPLTRLLTSGLRDRMKDIMESDFISVNTSTDQEEVAHVVQKYNLLSIPVVDNDGKLAGRITVDDVMDVIQEEANEDISHMTGTSEEEIYEDSSWRISRLRLPWLMTALVGELIAATVISRYEGEITQLLALSFFIPIITAMGGNVGMQSAAIVVRGLATGEILMTETFRRLMVEMRVALSNGIILSGALMLIISVWYRDWILCTIVGLGLFVVIVLTTTLGALIPIALKRLDIDPAIATGPFITTFNDIIGLVVYFSIAKMFL